MGYMGYIVFMEDVPMENRELMLRVRVSEGEMALIEKSSEAAGMTKSEYIRSRMLAEPYLSRHFRVMIEGFADANDQSPEWLLEHIVAGFFADLDAYEDVWEIRPKLLTGAGLLSTGRDLQRKLSKIYRNDYLRERIQSLLREEEMDFPLTSMDTDFMIENRAGRSWAESNDCKLEKRQREALGHPDILKV